MHKASMTIRSAPLKFLFDFPLVFKIYVVGGGMGVGGRGGGVVVRMLCLFSFLTAIYVVEKGHGKKRVRTWMNRQMDGEDRT